MSSFKSSLSASSFLFEEFYLIKSIAFLWNLLFFDYLFFSIGEIGHAVFYFFMLEELLNSSNCKRLFVELSYPSSYPESSLSLSASSLFAENFFFNL
jgi:hypothetical protein